MQEGETFTERLDRLRKLDAQPQAAAAAAGLTAAEPASNRSRKRLRKLKAAPAANGTGKPGKRLGKRQRQALKDQRLGQKLGHQTQPAGVKVNAQRMAASGPNNRRQEQKRV